MIMKRSDECILHVEQLQVSNAKLVIEKLIFV